MHHLFGVVLIVLLIMLLWETIALIFWLFVLAGYLIAFFALLLWLPIAAAIDLRRYLKRRRMASTFGLDAVTIALEQELTNETTVTLTQGSNGVWRPRT
jgi:hypothetical protein